MRVRCSDIEPRTPWGIYIYKRARVNETAKGQASASRGERARKKKTGRQKKGYKSKKTGSPPRALLLLCCPAGCALCPLTAPRVVNICLKNKCLYYTGGRQNKYFTPLCYKGLYLCLDRRSVTEAATSSCPHHTYLRTILSNQKSAR